MSAHCPSDNAVGWRSGDCGIDFTIAFEDYILILIPAASLLLVAPLRLRTIWSRTIKVVTPSILQLIKALSGLFFVGFSFGFLVASCALSKSARSAEIPAATVAFLASLAAIVLSYWEHVRSIRPSKVLQLYLVVALVVKAVHLRTIWTRQDDVVVQALGVGQVASCAAFLAAESVGKERILLSTQKRSPQDLNGLFSERLFLWLNSLFRRGYRHILSPGDLDAVDEDLASPETDRRFRLTWIRHYHRNPKGTMLRVIVSALRYDILMSVIPRLLLTAVGFAQPYLILRFIDYLEHPTEGAPNEGVLLVLATAVIYIGIATFTSWYWQSVGRFQVKLRGSLTTALHDKALRCRPDSENSALTLMNVDVERALTGLRWMHEYWSTTLTLGISLALLYTQVGIVFLAPLLLLIVMITISAQNGSTVRPKQKIWFGTTQDRISYITEVISSMKNVKLLGIGPSVLQRGNNFRDIEVDAQRSVRTAVLLNTMISLTIFQFSSLVMYGGYAIRTHYGGVPLNNARLFTSLSILKLVTTPLLITIQTIPGFLQSISSLERIQEYLITEDHKEPRRVVALEDSRDVSSIKGGFRTTDGRCIARLQDVSCRYNQEGDVINDVSCKFQDGKLSMIVGPVGSGKSTLLKALLGEAPITRGTVSVTTTDIALCDQTPWLWNASIKDNICGDLEYDKAWFSRVTWACGLHEDFKNLSDGINTSVGSDGTSLSGGQKNRISLARALYSRKRLVVLDDVLSGLDARTERLVFMRVFGPDGITKQLKCAVIFATHAVGWTRYSDTVVVVDKGRIQYQGCPDNAPAPYAIDLLGRPVTPPDSTFETLQDIVPPEKDTQQKQTPHDTTRPSDMRVYKQYLGSFGIPYTILYFVLCAAYSGGNTLQNLWLKWWAAAAPTSSPELGMYVGVFTGITMANCGILLFYLVFAFLLLLPRSSRYLHAKQWSALVKVAYTSWGTKDTGSVTNRFSQDISIIDSTLSMHFINFTIITFTVVAGAAILVVATPFIAATFPFVLVTFWAIQKVYLRTSKQLRILDLEAKAPLCTHFLETVSGVVTINTFGWSEHYRERNAELLRNSQVPFYLMQSAQNWLSLVLNLVVAGIAVIVMAIAVKLRNNVDAGYIGLALVEVMSLGEFCEHLVSSWTGLETSLGAVSRLNEFMDSTPPEEQGRVTPPIDWLSKGSVDIRGLTASYSETAEPILRDINVQIRPGAKIALCGRTGSGKSSLASALFGLLHVREGTIKVDGVDVTEVSQDLLRSKMVALPQDPYFSPGTVRDNLALVTLSSPDISDAAMTEALEKVGLLEKYEALALSSAQTWLSALDVVLKPADMLTKGQMQLFAMARAMLCKGQIVLVDEATSGLDHASEALVQKLLREEFAGRTIVAIAHHLKTIMDFDTVIIMDNGRIAEMGHPDELKNREGSLFGNLLRASQ